MPGRMPTSRVQLPRWLHTELAAQAEQLGLPTNAYIHRLLEDAAGIRDMPFSWRHVPEGRRKVTLATSDHLAHVQGRVPVVSRQGDS